MISTVASLPSLSDEQMYQILTNIGPKLKEYPANSKNYQPHWSELFPCVRYSLSTDGAFCTPCFLFSKARINSEFVSTPFHNWKNATGASHGALKRHSASHTHQHCVEQPASFKAVMEKKADSIKSQLVKQTTSRCKLTRQHSLQSLIAFGFSLSRGLA